MTENEAWESLMHALGYTFSDRTLCRDALTHRSFAHEHPKQAPTDNERLEFLGDAAVGTAVSLMLWETYPGAPEGELTRRRSDLVCESGLKEVAEELGLGEHLRLGRGEERSGGRAKARLLASAFEAIVGAILVDGGEGAVHGVVRRLFEKRIHQSAPGEHDYKSRFQEATQAASCGMPRYRIAQVDGPDHARRYTVEAFVGELMVASGSGTSKADAEQEAARLGLDSEAWRPEPGGDGTVQN